MIFKEKKNRGRHSEDAAQDCGEKPARQHRNRMLVSALVFLCMFGAVLGRLYYVHLKPAEQLNLENPFHEGTVSLPISRGDIRDKNGVILAMDEKVPTLWADPSRVTEAERIALMLNARLGIDEEETMTALSKRAEDGDARKFVYIKRWITDIPEELLRQVVAEAKEGLSITYEEQRCYPEGDLAAHLIGFVNSMNEACEGLEIEFDSWLKGVAGEYRALKDAKKNLLSSLMLDYRPPQGGCHVYLTIDAVIQRSLERALDKQLIECKAPRGMGLVMDAKTGAIVALASRPAFDLNNYDQYPPETWKNRTLNEVFEPGSSFKIVVAAGALDLGLITTETLIDCENGRFNPYGHTIRDVHKMGVEPFWKCFEESSNVAHVKVAALLGPKNLESFIRAFGFDMRCTQDLRKFEDRGLFSPKEKWSRLTMGALPIGQEIAVTMPQLARAFAVIANGGLLLEPYILDRVESRDGEIVYQGEARAKWRVISPETSAIMRDLCHRVVLNGTGTAANILEYRAGGKTGTAQVAHAAKRGYDPNKVTAVFAGFAPVADPRLVCVIVINEPGIDRHFGGFVCGPVFKEVMRDALIHMGVPEDPVQDGSLDQVADAEGAEDADTVTPPVEETELASAEPFVLEPYDDLDLVKREMEGTEWVASLPDFSGMTKHQAHQRLAELGIPWDPQGAGRVVEQTPAPGTPVNQVDICRLVFSNTSQEVKDDEKATM